MHIYGLRYPNEVPEHDCVEVDVLLENERPKGDGSQVAEHELNGVSVFASQTYGINMLVMDLVHERVEPLPVEEPVGGGVAHVLHQDAEGDRH